MADRDDEIGRFLAAAGWPDAGRRVLAADASFRRYDRVTDGSRGAVLMDAPPDKEDVRPYVVMARHLHGMGYSAPVVLHEDPDAGLVLLEDLGDDTYSRLIARGHDDKPLYELAVDVLIDLHRRGFGAAVPAGLPAYTDALFLREAELLVEWYLPAVGRPTDAAARADFLDCWGEILPGARGVADTLVLRDYHVDNLMLIPGRAGIAACGLLDFQDAVAGPLTYDLVSLLEDARRDVPPTVASAMRARYLAAFPGLAEDAFDRSFAILGAQRHCKVIGIFTRLCVRDGKAEYLHHIPRVWRLLEGALAHPALAPLAAWLDTHVPAPARIEPESEPAA